MDCIPRGRCTVDLASTSLGRNRCLRLRLCQCQDGRRRLVFHTLCDAGPSRVLQPLRRRHMALVRRDAIDVNGRIVDAGACWRRPPADFLVVGHHAEQRPPGALRVALTVEGGCGGRMLMMTKLQYICFFLITFFEKKFTLIMKHKNKSWMIEDFLLI